MLRIQRHSVTCTQLCTIQVYNVQLHECTTEDSLVVFSLDLTPFGLLHWPGVPVKRARAARPGVSLGYLRRMSCVRCRTCCDPWVSQPGDKVG